MHKMAFKLMFASSLLIVEMAGVGVIAQAEAAHRVKAMLVAQESTMHTSVSNRDVYRLRITPGSGEPFVAIAVDSYPGYANALPLHTMARNATFSVKLSRTPYCDQTDSLGQTTLRCFAIERSSWKGPKDTAEQWWK